MRGRRKSYESMKGNTYRKTHGMRNTKVYQVWIDMNRRCKRDANYAERGIAVCERWAKFEAFYADMGTPSDSVSLDRINNDGNYEPGNCRWADDKTQRRNQRRSVRATFENKTMTLAEWSERTGIDPELMARRLKSGWPTARALMEPVRKYAKR